MLCLPGHPTGYPLFSATIKEISEIAESPKPAVLSGRTWIIRICCHKKRLLSPGDAARCVPEIQGRSTRNAKSTLCYSDMQVFV
jgi:hypothetical protein